MILMLLVQGQVCRHPLHFLLVALMIDIDQRLLLPSQASNLQSQAASVICQNLQLQLKCILQPFCVGNLILNIAMLECKDFMIRQSPQDRFELFESEFVIKSEFSGCT